MSNADARVIANATRQAELEARHRDLTKAMPPIGTDGDSLRANPQFAGITDEMLAERATFNLQEHLKNGKHLVGPIATVHHTASVDLTNMTVEELQGLADAALKQAATKQGMEQ